MVFSRPAVDTVQRARTTLTQDDDRRPRTTATRCEGSLYIDDEGIHGEYAEPFDVLLDQGVLDVGRAILADREAGQIRMADLLGRPATSSNSKTPRALRALGGGRSLRAPAPARGAEGSNTSTLVHLLHTYSNTPELLTDLESVAWTVRRSDLQDEPALPSTERAWRLHDRLSETEMDAVVASYYRGASVAQLTRQYGINHWSVNKLVRERGQRLRQDGLDDSTAAAP